MVVHRLSVSFADLSTFSVQPTLHLLRDLLFHYGGRKAAVLMRVIFRVEATFLLPMVALYFRKETFVGYLGVVIGVIVEDFRWALV
jgi:hypothetical protein